MVDEMIDPMRVKQLFEQTDWHDHKGRQWDPALPTGYFLHNVLGTMSLPHTATLPNVNHIKPHYKEVGVKEVSKANIDLDEAFANHKPITRTQAEETLRNARDIFEPSDRQGAWAIATIDKAAEVLGLNLEREVSPSTSEVSLHKTLATGSDRAEER